MCGPRAVGRADRCCYCCTGVTFCRRRHPAAPRRLRRPPSRACDENGVTASRRQASGQVASHALGRGRLSFTPKRSTQTAQLGRGATLHPSRAARAPPNTLSARPGRAQGHCAGPPSVPRPSAPWACGLTQRRWWLCFRCRGCQSCFGASQEVRRRARAHRIAHDEGSRGERRSCAGGCRAELKARVPAARLCLWALVATSTVRNVASCAQQRVPRVAHGREFACIEIRTAFGALSLRGMPAQTRCLQATAPLAAYSTCDSRCVAQPRSPPPPPFPAGRPFWGRKWSLRGSLDGLDRGHGVRQRQR